MPYYIDRFNDGAYSDAIIGAAIAGDLEYVSKSIKLAAAYDVGKAFESAAMEGHIEILSFIWENAVLEAFDIKWALYRTGQGGHIEALLKIIELVGSKIDPKEYSDILEAAASYNHSHMVAKIFEIAKEEISDFEISKAFVNAAINGYIDIVTKLYEIASDKIELAAIKEALLYTSISGRTEVVLKILEVSGKANIDIAFQNAASNNHVNLITGIIETAGDAITDELYRKAFSDAASKNGLEVVSKIWDVASEKIDHKLLLETINKFAGNSRNTELIKTIIKLAGTKLSKKEFKGVFEDLVVKGNFDAAIKFQKMVGHENFIKKIDATNIMVSAILNGLEKSVEPNKYQAFSQLFAKAGIEIPKAHQHKLKEVKDNKNPADFEFINGLAHKLAKYYLTSNQPTDWLKIVKNYLTSSQPTEWLKIVNAVQNLDNDFALEVVTINGLIPEPFENDTIVYRGSHFPATDEDLSQFFDYGFRSFSQGGSQKMLGYYVSRSWNDAGKSGWSDGGTYVSTNSRVAAKYALECVNYNVNGVTTCGGGMNMNEKDRKFVFEIQLPKGSPKIFGADVNEFELVPSYIRGEDIIAIYEVNKSDTPTKVFVNPKAKKTPQLKLNDSEKAFELYNSLNSPYGYFKSGEKIINALPYTSQEDFYTKYTNDHYATDQDKLRETYYSNKPSYTDLGFKDAMVGECNPDYYCC